MALTSTVHKASVDVSDLDRGHYAAYNLTLARHPSETDERMMVRLAAFALCADADLAFGAGLSNSEEPDLYCRDLTGAFLHWIEVGQPDPRSLRKACGRAPRVSVFAYGRAAQPWWNKARGELSALANLDVAQLTPADSAALAGLAQRSMRLHALIQERSLTLTNDVTTLTVTPIWLQRGRDVSAG